MVDDINAFFSCGRNSKARQRLLQEEVLTISTAVALLVYLLQRDHDTTIARRLRKDIISVLGIRPVKL